ncbi:alpha-1,2-fucosyltransferase [Thalassospira marina]|uniref:Alpha-1,2-fucosyltransferase n=1 Tax=Thalassospira marina TaxID=2048283 RepID=A0ABN5FIS7_9PROT|nr:alpha-1,2-fucosyltransferase [Thalassospira marina]AUG54567.1 alpha-1,2-fucosyltransferase [Thalassospira marina]
MAQLKTPVVVGLSGGLGNQMFQYAAGRSLALKLNVPLELDISWFKGCLDRNYALDMFNVSATLREHKSSLPDFLQNFETRMSRRYARRRMGVPIYREPHFHFDPNFETIENPVFLEGYWQSERYFRKYAETIHADLRLRKPIPEACQNVMNDVRSSNAICVHVRRGDYVNNPEAARTHGVCSLDYYRRAVSTLCYGLENPQCFVFSDDPKWVHENIVLPCCTTVVDFNDSNNVHWDLALMAACKHFVIANSSLSWWGAWLGNARDKRVIAPMIWFKDDKDTKDLIPATWERL